MLLTVQREIDFLGDGDRRLNVELDPTMVIRKLWSVCMEVLDSRTNFYRDIQTVASTATTTTSIVYKMAVAQYQVAERKTEP